MKRTAAANVKQVSIEKTLKHFWSFLFGTSRSSKSCVFHLHRLLRRIVVLCPPLWTWPENQLGPWFNRVFALICSGLQLREKVKRNDGWTLPTCSDIWNAVVDIKLALRWAPSLPFLCISLDVSPLFSAFMSLILSLSLYVPLSAFWYHCHSKADTFKLRCVRIII